MTLIKFTKALTLSTVLTATLLTSGCLGVYTIDLPQGTPITQAKARQVQVGMTQAQVLHLLGSPALKDPLSPNRWDYIYDYKAGTDGRRAGKSDIKNAAQYLSIYFDNNGLVAMVNGVQKLPNIQP